MSGFNPNPGRDLKSFGLTGLKGSSKAYLLSLWREKGRGPLLIIVPSLQKAESLVEDLRFFSPETKGCGSPLPSLGNPAL